jgi:hypothetical protein
MRDYSLILMFFIAIVMTSCGSGTTTKEENVSGTVEVVDSVSTDDVSVDEPVVEGESSDEVLPIQ